MKYLLDTNVCIHLLRGNAPVATRYARVGLAACAISEITVAELRVGAESSQRLAYQLGLVEQMTAELRVLPISPAIPRFARESARLRQAGTPLDAFDLLIGATALHHGLVLVTNNSRHFTCLSGLVLEDWLLPVAS